MFKKFLTLLLAVVGVFTLASCNPTDEGYTDAELLEMISEAMAELDITASTSADLTLPNTGLHDVTVTWESKNTDYIANDGTVTRPTKTEGNQTVRIVATLTLETQSLTKEFNVTVLAADEYNDTEKVALDKADLFLQEGTLFADLTLPTSGDNGTTITWSSDKTDYIANDGTVTRPAVGEGEELVTLTATITSGSVSDTKVFQFRVQEDVLVNTIAELKATAEEGDNVLVRALILGHFDKGTYTGYYAYDGTGFIYIHLGSAAPSVTIGEVYQIAGEWDVYFGMPQIALPTEETQIDMDITWPTAKVVTPADLIAYTTTVDADKFSEYINITGTVTYDGTYYYLEDEAGNAIELNDDSDIALVIAELGKSVTINGFYHSYHSSHGNHQISFTGKAEDLTVNVLPDDEALAADLAVVGADVPGATLNDITLPTEGSNGTQYTNWTSSNTAVFASDGTFVAPAATTVTVTFTATATMGTETGTATIEVVVPAESTLAEANAGSLGDFFLVTGVVFSESYYGFHIWANDEFLFVSGTDELDNIAPGDELTLVLKFDYIYHDAAQFKILEYTNNSSGNALPTAEAVELSDVINVEYPFGKLVTVTGEVELIVDGNYTDVYLMDAVGNMIQVHYNSDADVIEAFDGKVITVDVILYGWDYIWFQGAAADVTEVTGGFTDTDMANAILADIVAGLGSLDGVAADFTFPATYEDSDPDATVTWASDATAVVGDDGVVTIQNGTTGAANVTVTVTYNAVVVSRVLAITVIDGDDLTPTDVATALLEDDGTVVVITGVVSALNKYGDPFIQDSDGTAIIAEYFPTDVNVGDEIVVLGKLSTDTHYDERRRLEDPVLLSTTSTGNTPFVITTADNTIGVEDDSLAIANKLYKMTLTVDKAPAGDALAVDSIFDKYGYVFFTGDGTTLFKMEYEEYAPYFEYVYAYGDTIEMTFVISDVDFYSLRIVAVEMPALTDAQNLVVAKEMLTLMGTYSEDIALPATMTDYNATITWSSDTPTVISDAGVVTRPASGAGDATVVLTATIDVNGTTDTKAFTITVPEEGAAAANVASVFTAADNDPVFITGVVTSVLVTGAFTMEDADGTAIFVDTYSTTYTDWATEVTVAVGDEVEVTGLKSEYNGNDLVDTVSLVEVLSSGNAITDPIVVDDIAAWKAAVDEFAFGKRFVFTGVVLDDQGYYIYFYNDNGANRLGVVTGMSAPIATDTLVSGDVVKWTVTLYGTNGTYTDPTKIFRFALAQDSDVVILSNDGGTVASAISASADDELFIQGVVTSVLADGTFTIEDADGTAIYVDDYNTSFADFDVDVVVAVGDLVKIVAAKSDYNGYHSIDSLSYYNVVSSGNAITAPIVVSDIAAWKAAVTADSFGKRYTFTDVVITGTGYYAYFYEDGNGDNRMGAVTSMSSAIVGTFGVGDTVTMTVTLYGTNGTYTDITKIFRFSVSQDSDATITVPAT